MIEKDLVVVLRTVCPRVYPIFMPEDVSLPALTYQVVFSGTEQSVSGDSCGLSTRFQVDVYAKGYGEAKRLKDLVIKEVINMNGGSVSAQDLYEESIKLHRQLIDFTIKE